ncbi:ParB family chromosome partitioning protein [Rhizobium sp. BK313]|uniref:ParB/RepB/Spo0J family partition protein n=1 Tax=Rhizobium sp. BK313 TaxID=2587081 RepID=UPI00105D47A3|nr:ParB/RepB/Spo0J family partition protein [Rhizobium sp. BK313]MBB3458797.1 ParB family chromosome partitioning protein [Rhizobium sp. BK313]
MQVIKVDPRSLKENPDDARRAKSSPQSDALLLATVKAVGIIQPPVVSPEFDGGNGYIIQAGHRRVKQAIAAGLEEIDVLIVEAADDNGAMRSMIENIAREPLNPVDQWRGVERLVALGWTEEAISVALALSLRQIRKLRLLANVLPAMLDQMAFGDMPNEQQLRTIAAASLDEQKEVWKANRPKKNERADWYNLSRALSKTRMYAKDASFGEDLRQAYGIEWVEDLFAPADEDTRYTTNVEAFLGAQQEWMTGNLPKKGVVADVNAWGQPELPKKAERIYGKPSKADHVAMYLDRDGKVQSVHFRMPEEKKGGAGSNDVRDGETSETRKPRPDVTQKGQDMIGDFRTEALHDALARAPIEDDMLMALLVLAFAGLNVRVDSGANDHVLGRNRFSRHAARLFSESGRFSFDMETVRIAARAALIDVLSCRRGMSNSGVVSRIAGDAIGADGYLPNMATEAFLLCLSRQALEAVAREANVLPCAKVRETRAALIEQFGQEQLVHPVALFAPHPNDIDDLLKAGEEEPQADPDNGLADDGTEAGRDDLDPTVPEIDHDETAYGIAAE